MKLPQLMPIALTMLSSLALAQQATIVRTPAPIDVDGRVEDWAFIQSRQSIKTPAGEGVAAFRLACDDDFLYALFEVADDSPLKNQSAVLEEILKGGDCVGLALEGVKGPKKTQRILVAQVDGKPVVMALRPEWPEKRPHTFASPVKAVKMDYVGPVDGAKAALRGIHGGYVAEIALPWKGLGLALRDTYAFDAQVILSDPAGTVNVESAWWHSSGGDMFTVEDLPTEAELHPELWGEAKVRNAAPPPDETAGSELAPRPAGLPIDFDMPRDAKASLVVTDGDGFVLRELLRAESLKAGAHTVEWDGRDRYGEPLPPGDYHWKLAIFDGMGTRFLGSVGNSARPPYRTEDGKGSMGGQHGGASIIAANGHGIFIAGGTEEGHPAMRAIDAEGRTLWKCSMGGFGSSSGLAATDDCVYVLRTGKRSDGARLLRLDARTGKPLPIGEARDGARVGDTDFGVAVSGMCAAGGRIFMSLAASNRIAVVEQATGAALASVQVEAPRGLARVDDGRILVCTGGEVRMLDIGTGRLSAFLSGLDSPVAVAVDGDGFVYVSELGGRQQVARFDSAGKPAGRIGTEGGRPLTQSPYDPNSLRDVRGLAIGPDGNLWMVEKSPLRRVASFSRDGAWLADQFGPVAYNVTGCDLDDLGTVYYQTSQGTPCYARTHVDYEAYARDPEDPMAAWSIQETMYMTQTGKDAPADAAPPAEEDLMAGSMRAGYGHVVSFAGANGQRYLWRIAKGNRATMAGGAAIWRRSGDRWIPAAFVTNSAKGGKSWSDGNGDGLVQQDELYGMPPTREFAWLDRDLVLYGKGGSLAPARIDARGVPYYDGGRFSPYVEGGEAYAPGGWVFNSMPDADGAVYFAANYGTHRHLSFWDRASENQIIKVADGKVRWIIGQHAANPRCDSDLTTLSGIAGIVDGIVLAHIVEPGRYIAFTTDGLTLGNVIVDETGRQPRVGPTAIYIESFTGLFVKDPATGKRVLFSVRSGDDPILEVTGPGRMERREGTIRLDTARPREAIADGAYAIPYETWWGNNGGGYKIDGLTYEWLPRSAGLPIMRGGALVGDVRLRRDAGSLYVLADALSPAADEAQGDDPELREGVELLLSSRDAGATRILLVGGSRPVALRRNDADDGWAPLDGATVAVLPRWQGYGWRLEAEIPLSSLPQALCAETPQTFRRCKPGSQDIVVVRETRLDLRGTTRVDAALRLREGADIKRFVWRGDAGGR